MVYQGLVIYLKKNYIGCMYFYYIDITINGDETCSVVETYQGGLNKRNVNIAWVVMATFVLGHLFS